MSQVHSQARTTPITRAKIRSCADSSTELALRYNTTVATIRKWPAREDMQDRSHCPHTLNATLTPGQELLVIELRRTLCLPLDDLLVLVRECGRRLNLDHHGRLNFDQEKEAELHESGCG